MTRDRKILIAGSALAVLALGWLILRPSKPKASQAEASPLYTGKEPKRKVKLYFPSTEKPGFETEDAEIFATASKSAQAKQVLEHLFRKPASPALARAFPEGSAWREVFLDENSRTMIVDLDAGVSRLHPGGLSGEFATLYALVRTMTENFKDVQKVQVLLGGEAAETLAGHFDLSSPLSKADF